MQSHHGYDPGVSVLGYSTQMRQLLGGADAFVTTTAGSSIQEARVCGAPTVCYGFLIGHLRDNVDALAEHGVARPARNPAELADHAPILGRWAPSRQLAEAGGS